MTNCLEAGEIAYEVRILAIYREDPSQIPSTHRKMLSRCLQLCYYMVKTDRHRTP